MEHSSHGDSDRVVMRVERCRVLCAAAWSGFPGGSEKRFNGLISENNEGGDRLEACRPGLIATGLANALHDLLATELLQVGASSAPAPPRAMRGRPRGWDHIVPTGRAYRRVPPVR